MAIEFTKIFNKPDGTIGRKEGVRLASGISYIEPCFIGNKNKEGGDEIPHNKIPCTKLFYGSTYVVLEIRISDFLELVCPKIEFL